MSAKDVRGRRGGNVPRMDYLILNSAQGLKMRIANWLPKQDHARILINLQLPALGKRSSSGNPWSIPQPRLFNLNDSNRASCKNSVKKALEDLLEAFKESKDLDMLSENAARIILRQSLESSAPSQTPTRNPSSYPQMSVVLKGSSPRYAKQET